MFESLEDRRVLAAAFLRDDTTFSQTAIFPEARAGTEFDVDLQQDQDIQVSFAGGVAAINNASGSASNEQGFLAQVSTPPTGTVLIPTVESACQFAVFANSPVQGGPAGAANWNGGVQSSAQGFGAFRFVEDEPPQTEFQFNGTIFLAAYGDSDIGPDLTLQASIGTAIVTATRGFADTSWDIVINVPGRQEIINDVPGLNQRIDFSFAIENDDVLEFQSLVQGEVQAGSPAGTGITSDGQWELVAACWGAVTEIGVAPLPGDFDGNRIVDEDDFQIWFDNSEFGPGGQADFGEIVQLESGSGTQITFPGGATYNKGDANLDGFVDENDLAVWAANITSGLLLVSTESDASDGIYTYDNLSLREALSIASAGDKIIFAPWVDEITLGGTQLTVTDNVTIAGPGAEKLRIDANDASRVFAVSSGVEATISSMTITGGQVTAPTHGGAIRNDGDLTLDSVVVTDNHASYIGGAIYSVGSAKLHIKDSTFTLNSAGSTGGAIYSDSAQVDALVIERSTFFDNEANNAGAIYLSGDDGLTGTVTISNSTFSGNRALTTSGGAIKNSASAPPVTIINSTIAYNTSVTGGGGIDMHNNSDNRFLLHNTILAHNDATSATTDNLNRAVNSASSYNLIGYGGTSGLTNGLAGNILLGSGVSARLAPLDYYGGKTKTHALYYDSPAIEAGDNDIADDWDLVFDQRGFERNTDSEYVLGDGVDIGAFELAFDEYYS